MKNEHYLLDTTGLFYCPLTGKQTDHVWSMSSINDSCKHCTGDDSTVGERLHKLNEQRKQQLK